MPALTQAATTQTTLRFLRILQGILLASMVLDPTIAEMISPDIGKALNPFIFKFLAATSATYVGIAVWIQITRVRPALETLQSKQDDARSLYHWRSGVILSSVMLEAVVLTGFALRFMGGTFLQSLAFYCIGILLMLIYWPRRP